MYQISKEEYGKLCQIIKKESKKRKLNYQDFLSYCHEKIVLICNKYDKSKNDNFINYASRCLRGYALNYIRDCLYPKTIPRKFLQYYVEFNNLERIGWSKEAISHALGEPLEYLEDIFANLNNFRFDNHISYEESYNL